ncbi:MAG TPA: SDR family oxidoreductase [Pyrinomonadaceae bacterium]|nr:SDR family oxidoreductase [Pyrinomonadaceae bacterium]
MNESEKKVAVITGAATGIGRALAERLAAQGLRLCLADINKGGLDVVAHALRSNDCEVATHTVDVADRRQMEVLSSATLAQFGRVDWLINNAGVGLCGDVEEVSIADIEWIMGINFWGMVYGVKYFLPLLKAREKAYIVNLSSVFGMIAPPGQAAYAASKFAVRGFTEALRHELAGTGVQVSNVHPGGIRTGIAKTSRIGANTRTGKREEFAAIFDVLAGTTPERAADRIVNGVLQGETRILIGPDAKQINVIHRLFPERYWRIIGPLIEMRTRGLRVDDASHDESDTGT